MTSSVPGTQGLLGPPSGGVAAVREQLPPAADAGFLTVLTLLTALTGLTADMVDEVDIIG